MILNDLNQKVGIKFFKEITINDDRDGEDITYVFPDTSEFISVLKRKFVKP